MKLWRGVLANPSSPNFLAKIGKTRFDMIYVSQVFIKSMGAISFSACICYEFSNFAAMIDSIFFTRSYEKFSDSFVTMFFINDEPINNHCTAFHDEAFVAGKTNKSQNKVVFFINEDLMLISMGMYINFFED